jgi:acetolactate decarboxylase
MARLQRFAIGMRAGYNAVRAGPMLPWSTDPALMRVAKSREESDMPALHCTFPNGLWQALQRHHAMTGEPLSHIVRAALADYLQVEHSTLYQVSTSVALVQGVYQGAVRVGTLRQHGDHGLGTFEHLDGEMVVIDGRCFQVRSDGSVREAADDVLTPFAVVTRFVPDVTVDLAECADLTSLTTALDRLRHSDNVFFALRVDGHFDAVKTRAMCKTADGVPLAVAAATQPEFEFERMAGTLVGFWTPPYAKTLNIPGYHLHFLSQDRQHGGHLLQCRGRNLRLQIQREGTLSIALPETEDFFRADLRQDPAVALERAETEAKGR